MSEVPVSMHGFVHSFESNERLPWHSSLHHPSLCHESSPGYSCKDLSFRGAASAEEWQVMRIDTARSFFLSQDTPQCRQKAH